MVLLDTGTPGTSREIYSEDAHGETHYIFIISQQLLQLAASAKTRDSDKWK